MDSREKTERALKLLREKADELQRLPKRSDFSGEDVCFIKQKLGPWPRALEAAGLKEKQEISSKEKSRLKRERRKKERTPYDTASVLYYRLSRFFSGMKIRRKRYLSLAGLLSSSFSRIEVSRTRLISVSLTSARE